MAKLPLTRLAANKERQGRIRDAVSNTQSLAGMAHVARERDIPALTALLCDPRVSQPIYTLPAQISGETVAEFIEKHLDERARGEGLLMVNTDDHDVATAYYDIQIWPEWAACELGGAISLQHQNTGRGGSSALAAFSWLFEAIGVDLICETAALDNVRTGKLLERIGFTYLGKIDSELPDGSLRPSRYWELNKADWQEMHSTAER